MTSRKNKEIVESLKEKPKLKEDPVQDIEDLIKTPYFSPLQTRSQRLKGSKLKAISSLATTSTSSANINLKQISLLKPEIAATKNRDVVKNTKPKESIVSLAPETAIQVDTLGLETVSNKNVILAELCHPVKETTSEAYNPLAAKQGKELPESISVDMKTEEVKVNAKVEKPKRKSKTPSIEKSTDGSDNVASSVSDVKSPKPKTKRKTKQLAVSQEAAECTEKKEDPIPRKKTPKKEPKEKKAASIKKTNKFPPAEEVAPDEKTLELQNFRFDPHKISLKVNENHEQIKEEPKKKKRSSPSKSKELAESEPEIKLEKWAPDQWLVTLENIKLMRSSQEAPVDTMGCHKCCDENADPKTKRFQNLVALMLSSQTRDQVTYEVMQRLRDNTCTPASIASMDTNKLMNILQPVSFYKNKTKYLQKTATILVERYDSDIPNNVNELIKLPGVGPKMAHICMSVAWDLVTGIGVDTHVHRISNRLGWVRNATKDPEQTRKQLELWIPPEYWREVNYLLVGFGQTCCTPVRPKCDQCLNRAFCPSANATPSPSKRGSPSKTQKAMIS